MRAVIAPFLILIAGVAACNDSQPGTPTSPEFAAGGSPSACSYTQLKKDVDAEWPNNAGAATKDTGQAVSALLTTMQQNQADSNIATATGFRILRSVAIATANNQPGTTPAAGAQLAIDLLLCMDVPGSSIPSSAIFVSALGPNGAFAVRDTGLTDAVPVASHDLAWNVAPVSPNTWSQVAARDTSAAGGASANLSAAVKRLFLVFGQPGATTGFTNTGDQLLNQSLLVNNAVFNWGTVPLQVFKTGDGSPGIVVSQCDITPAGQVSSYTPGFLQHNRAGTNPEILGFVSPNCPADVKWIADIQRRAPNSLAQRLWQLFVPEAANALVLSGGSGSKGSNLSPWGAVDPGVVNLTFGQTPDKSRNTVGVSLFDTDSLPLQVGAFSEGGTPLGTVFTWIEATNNQGTNVLVCKNWAYTDAAGVATFRNAYLNKAGGYTLTFKTVGTKTTTGVNDLTVAAGTEPSSALFNVKNGTPNTSDCSGTNVFVFDPTKPADQQNLPPVPSGLSP